MPQLYLHIGTHKTGTTSIQEALSRGTSELGDFGYSYPVVGKPGRRSGHHNLAWEIAGDARFDPKFGRIDQLFDMVPRDTNLILSSEDFSSAVFRNPDRFNKFINRARYAGYAPTIVVYIRNQIDYMSSLYRELLNHGLAIDFGKFCEEILANGQFVWRDWIFPICNLQLVNRLAEFGEIKIVVRSYDHIEGSVVEDFARVIGLGRRGIAKSTARTNISLTVPLAFDIFFRARCGRDLIRAEKFRVRDFFANANTEISNSAKRAISRRFYDTNREVLGRFDLPAFPRMIGIEAVDDPLPTMEDVFSDKLISVIINEGRPKK